MSLKEETEKMKKIHENLLIFIDQEEGIEENYINLQNLFYDQKIQEKKYSLISLFHMIVNISNYHHHYPNFYDKIIKILDFF